MTRRSVTRLLTLGVVAAVVLAFAVASPARAATAAAYPALPLADDRGFLGNLSSPTLDPGTSGTIGFTLGDPLSSDVVGAQLTFQVYAFNGFPGGGVTTVSVAGAPVLSNATGSGSSVGVAVGTLAPGGLYRGSVSVASSTTTPNGAFAVRTALAFTAGGTGYLLESRGWFNASVWSHATMLPNGSATLNLTVLGVSGVLPETAVVVSASTLGTVLAVVLALAAVFVGVGAYLYFRRGPASTSGAR